MKPKLKKLKYWNSPIPTEELKTDIKKLSQHTHKKNPGLSSAFSQAFKKNIILFLHKPLQKREMLLSIFYEVSQPQ